MKEAAFNKYAASFVCCHSDKNSLIPLVTWLFQTSGRAWEHSCDLTMAVLPSVLLTTAIHGAHLGGNVAVKVSNSQQNLSLLFIITKAFFTNLLLPLNYQDIL